MLIGLNGLIGKLLGLDGLVMDLSQLRAYDNWQSLVKFCYCCLCLCCSEDDVFNGAFCFDMEVCEFRKLELWYRKVLFLTFRSI